MKKELVGDETLVLAMHSLPEGKILPLKKETIVEILYSLKDIPEYQDLLRGCTFDTDRPSLYSPEIEDWLWNFVLAGHISSTTEGGQARPYLRGINARYERIKSRLSEEDVRLGDKFSLDFRERLLM